MGAPVVFPAALDAFEDPGAADTLATAKVPHTVQHQKTNAALLAIETKVGADGSDDPASIDYKIAHVETVVGAAGNLDRLVSLDDLAERYNALIDWLNSTGHFVPDEFKVPTTP